jgi:hypothetical protein
LGSFGADAGGMSDAFAARCRDCRFQWNTQGMAEGLRLIGSCPKCGGELEFGTRGAEPAAPAPSAPVAEPHLVLGIPRL